MRKIKSFDIWIMHLNCTAFKDKRLGFVAHLRMMKKYIYRKMQHQCHKLGVHLISLQSLQNLEMIIRSFTCYKIIFLHLFNVNFTSYFSYIWAIPWYHRIIVKLNASYDYILFVLFNYKDTCQVFVSKFIRLQVLTQG